LLGVLFGAVGRTIYLGGFQQWFSILAGVVILLTVIFGVVGKTTVHFPGITKLNRLVQQTMRNALQHPGAGSMLLLGMANGLLPCGMVYIALTAAIATGTMAGAAGFMVAFGLGTVPAMLLLSYFGFLVSISARNLIRRSIPFVVSLMGLLLILRGLGLGITFISPALTQASKQVIGCH